jgi:hypothetical protein
MVSTLVGWMHFSHRHSFVPAASAKLGVIEKGTGLLLTQNRRLQPLVFTRIQTRESVSKVSYTTNTEDYLYDIYHIDAISIHD